MWLLVSGSQVRLKRMPGKARELCIFTEGSGETQGAMWGRSRDAGWGSMRPVRGQFLLQYLIGHPYHFCFLEKALRAVRKTDTEQILKSQWYMF